MPQDDFVRCSSRASQANLPECWLYGRYECKRKHEGNKKNKNEDEAQAAVEAEDVDVDVEINNLQYAAGSRQTQQC